MYQYENGEPIDPKEFFSEHNYHDSLIDPLTLKCLRSPTYILSSNLKPYISNQLDMRRYGTLGMHPQNDAFTSNIVPFSFEGPMDTYSKYELVENIMSLPEDWFSMRITWDNYIFDQFSMFGNNIFTSAEIIHNSARQLFLNKWVHGEYAYDDIVISKNWYDEVFISCKNKMGVTTYYINLAWFHLLSPSLINHTLFTKN